nr:hypothetical protein Iba_scaffold2471.2CG0160 [Ipomoea batatas]
MTQFQLVIMRTIMLSFVNGVIRELNQGLKTMLSLSSFLGLQIWTRVQKLLEVEATI